MKYMLTWTERPQGSPMEYENAQKRILEVFTQWKAPSNFKIELFVIRVGDWGGYMLLDCDDPTAVHKFCSMLPAFVFEARPVIPIDDAVRVELEIDRLPRWAETQMIVGSFTFFGECGFGSKRKHSLRADAEADMRADRRLIKRSMAGEPWPADD